jgi:hypothetical protein
MILQAVLDGMLAAVLWLFDTLFLRALVLTVLACAAAAVLIPAAWMLRSPLRNFWRGLTARS